MYKFLVFLIWCVLPFAASDLTLTGTKCGTLTCKSHEYCSPFERQCRPCVDICNKDHHNFQADLCVSDCQDYLHDIRYVKTGVQDSNGVDFGGDIKRVYTLATVALTLVCLVIVGLLATVAFKVYRWSRKNSIRDFWNDLIKKQDESSGKPAANNGGVVLGNGKPDLRLEMPASVVQSEMSPVTLTTSINTRCPAEDSALDYAYDNHGMSTGTPSPHSAKTARESNF